MSILGKIVSFFLGPAAPALQMAGAQEGFAA
jgi:hypothetical protein